MLETQREEYKDVITIEGLLTTKKTCDRRLQLTITIPTSPRSKPSKSVEVQKEIVGNCISN